MPGVYFIRECDGDFVKIGRTDGFDPGQRLRLCQTGNPRRLYVWAWLDETRFYRVLGRAVSLDPSTASAEQTVHNMFRRQHVRGEWFRFTKTIEAFALKHRLLVAPPVTPPSRLPVSTAQPAIRTRYSRPALGVAERFFWRGKVREVYR